MRQESEHRKALVSAANKAIYDSRLDRITNKMSAQSAVSHAVSLLVNASASNSGSEMIEAIYKSIILVALVLDEKAGIDNPSILEADYSPPGLASRHSDQLSLEVLTIASGMIDCLALFTMTRDDEIARESLASPFVLLIDASVIRVSLVRDTLSRISDTAHEVARSLSANAEDGVCAW